jgi:hypothetical protein
MTAEVKELAQRHGPVAIAELVRLARHADSKGQEWQPAASFSIALMAVLYGPS